MNFRSTIYWLVSILTLVLCLIYNPSTTELETADPIPLTSYLDVEPTFFYYNNNQFNANVIGQLRLDIKTENLTVDISHYDALVLEGYQFKQDIELSLNWKVNDQTHHIFANRTSHSINRINFYTDDMNEISDLHLLFTTTHELGLKSNFQDLVSFQSIHLDHLNNHSGLALNFSEWNDITPVKLSSINGYTNSSDLHYKELILRLGCWLIVAALLAWALTINGTHLIFTVFLAWLFCCYFFVSNHINQNQQINQAFASGQSLINRTDQQTKELAATIAKILDSPNKDISTHDKLILLGSNTFYILRLKYHLSNFDMAINSDLQTLLNTQISPNFIYLLTENQFELCFEKPENYWLLNQVKVIHVENNICLLRKK